MCETLQLLDMHPLAATSHSRLLETDPKLFVFETSYYAFCGQYCFFDSSARTVFTEQWRYLTYSNEPNVLLVAFSDIWKFEVEIFFRDQQHIVYEIRLIAIREVSPPFGEEHRGLEQDISFPANKHLLILGKCYAVHINASSL